MANKPDHKPYINGWRRWELAFIRQALLHGYDVHKATRALERINIKMRVPIRTFSTIEHHCRPYRTVGRHYQRLLLAERYLYGKRITIKRAAEIFVVADQVASKAIKDYKKGEFDYLAEYYPSLILKRPRELL